MLYGILASRSSKLAQVISESCHPSMARRRSRRIDNAHGSVRDRVPREPRSGPDGLARRRAAEGAAAHAWPSSRSKRGRCWPSCRRSSTIRMRPLPIDLARQRSRGGTARTMPPPATRVRRRSSSTRPIRRSWWPSGRGAIRQPHRPVIVEGAFSTSGGLTWTSFTASRRRCRPASTATRRRLRRGRPTSAWPSTGNNNFYVLSSEHNANDQTGAVMLRAVSASRARRRRPDQLATGGDDQRRSSGGNTRNATNPTPLGGAEPVAGGR